MKGYYLHYTLEKLVESIKKNGMYSDSSYTLDEYYDAYRAGQAVGVMAHNIDCVLKFRDDGLFKKQRNVSATGRFGGGGFDYLHLRRIRPIAIRKIHDRNWSPL